MKTTFSGSLEWPLYVGFTAPDFENNFVTDFVIIFYLLFNLE